MTPSTKTANVERNEQEAERRRQMALRHVRQYPDPVLRRTAQPVSEFDGELVALAERMESIMVDSAGVGLAATQLGLLQRIFAFQFSGDEAPATLVNPTIIATGDETEIESEGCLSLGDLVHVEVPRATSIVLEGFQVDGAEVHLELEGFAARVCQHEIDHLDGILIIDRAVDDAARKAALAQLRPRP